MVFSAGFAEGLRAHSLLFVFLECSAEDANIPKTQKRKDMDTPKNTEMFPFSFDCKTRKVLEPYLPEQIGKIVSLVEDLEKNVKSGVSIENVSLFRNIDLEFQIQLEYSFASLRQDEAVFPSSVRIQEYCICGTTATARNTFNGITLDSDEEDHPSYMDDMFEHKGPGKSIQSAFEYEVYQWACRNGFQPMTMNFETRIAEDTTGDIFS